jgi:glutamate formiminotransferase/glutamate formiminotransferase/formiminotetrahydrofolate cyclodeaminase
MPPSSTNTTPLVECVPNFSEGRNLQTIDHLVRVISSVETACVLDTHIDPDHNRSVITFVAAPNMVSEAAFQAVATASSLIDIKVHHGEHPRLGAIDVLPFVPLAGVTMDQAVSVAHRAGERIARELSIPVFFYQQAALKPERTNLEDVRRGAYELLREQIATEPSRRPDLGPLKVHDTAGAIIIGARPLLIAFNINLKSNDLSIGRSIARAVRARDGGLPFLKALAFTLHSQDVVQVSMNLVNYKVTGMNDAYLAVEREAQRLGVEIGSVEIVGLVPEDALDSSAEYFSRLAEVSDKILERRIERCFRSN